MNDTIIKAARVNYPGDLHSVIRSYRFLTDYEVKGLKKNPFRCFGLRQEPITVLAIFLLHHNVSFAVYNGEVLKTQQIFTCRATQILLVQSFSYSLTSLRDYCG